MTYLSYKLSQTGQCTFKTTYQHIAIVYLPDENKYAFYNADKHELKPCRFNSESETFADIYKYIKNGKVKRIDIISESEHVYYKEIDDYRKRE